MERERLAYPITQIAFHVTHSTKSLFSHRITWLGFGIAASIAILNGFSFLYPTLPTLPIKRIGGWRGFGHLFTEKPWNAIGGISMSYYPVRHRTWIVDAARPIVLQLVFLYLLQGTISLERVPLACPVYPGFPYIDRQCFGAAIGIFISVVVLNLRHFRGVLRISRHRTGEDANEPISYRLALWGIVVGLAILFILFQADRHVASG